MSSRSKIVREDIKWQELLHHFRSVQSKHEKARRQALGGDVASYSVGMDDFERQSDQGSGSDRVGRSTVRPQVRRKVTGEITIPVNTVAAGPTTPFSSRSGILSPLNPRARGQSGLLAGAVAAQAQTPLTPAAVLAQQQKQKRTISLTRKS